MSEQNVRPQALRGFRDFLPAQQRVRQQIIATLREVFELHGFAPLDTPALEYYETLTGKYGEDERLIYHFQDHGGREVGLRYDLTVPLARVIGNYHNTLLFPFKRYHIGPVWRGDRPQHGRYREFYQCDFDIVGSASAIADAEILATLLAALDRLGFREYRIVLNNRKLLRALARYAGVGDAGAGTMIRALDKLDKIGRDGVRDEMLRGGLDSAAVMRALDFATRGAGNNAALLAETAPLLADDAEGRAALDELRRVLELLPALSDSADKVVLDLSLARGLDYYTGPIYEVLVDRPKIGALGSGGRYDELVGMFSGRDLPTVGASLGLERLIDVLTEHKMITTTPTASQVYVAVLGAAGATAALQLARRVREAGLPAEVGLEPGDKLGKQLKYAAAQGIPIALIAGPDEIAAGTVQVKDLARNAQQTVLDADLLAAVRAILAGPELDETTVHDV